MTRRADDDFPLAGPHGGAPAASKATPLLTVEDLTVRYGMAADELPAVDGVGLHVQSGQFLSIVGESGSGKSTLIRAILGLTPRTAEVHAGEVAFSADGRRHHLLGLDDRQLRTLRQRHIGFVPQSTSSALNPVINVEKHFRHAQKGSSRKDARARAREALEGVGFRDPDRVLGSYAHQLSGGMMQRVVLAIAIVRDPQLVVADEPTTGLDLSVQRQLMLHLQSLASTSSRGVVFVSHDLGLVEEFATDVAVMYRGRVVEYGPTSEVMNQPEHPYTWSLIQAIPRRGEPLRTPVASRSTLVVDQHTCAFADRCPFLPEEVTDVPGRTALVPVNRGHLVARCCEVPR